MPPRLSSSSDDPSLAAPPINPADADMGQNSNGNKRSRGPREDDDELDDDEDEEGSKKERTPSNRISLTVGRKIEIAFIKDKSRRHITFSKRKAGIMKKVYPPDRHH
jgi:pheromone receptor transcription factor